MVDVDAAEDAYAATKAMGDRDREVGFFIFISKKMYLIFYYQALSNRPKSDRTADVRTVFKRDMKHVNTRSTGTLVF